MKRRVNLWPLPVLALVCFGLTQSTLTRPSQISALGTTAGQALVSNGSVTGWGTPTIPASSITSGTVPPARLGSGTASSSTCLLGNSTWGACGTGGAHAGTHITGGSDIIPNFTSTGSGLVPPSAGGTTNFLRADGTFAPPPNDVTSVNGATVSSANFNKTLPSIPAGTTPVTFQASGANVSAYIDNADEFDVRRRKPFMDAEFLSTSAGNMSEFLGAAVSAGTNTTAAAAAALGPNHPGVVLARSSTTTNSGYQYSTTLTMLRLGGGEQTDFIVWLPSAMTGTTLRFGFQDSVTSTPPVDGAYIEFAAAYTPTCKTSSNSTTTTSASIATLSASTWYHLRVKVDGVNSVTCTIWSDAGVQQGTVSNTTNIPTASGRETGMVAIGTNSGTTAADLFAIDYLSLGWATALARGK